MIGGKNVRSVIAQRGTQKTNITKSTIWPGMSAHMSAIAEYQ